MAKTTPFAYLDKAVQTKLNKLNRLVKKTFKKTIKYTVVYDLHSINSLGTCLTTIGANGKESRIRLNPMLLNELKMAYIDDVVAHEFAHATTDQVKEGRNPFVTLKPHGREFKATCRLFGIDGKSTTNVAKGSKVMKSGGAGQQKNFDYVCGCKDKVHSIGSVRHNRAQAGKTYTCNSCRVAIWLKGASKPTGKSTYQQPKSNRRTFPYACGCPNEVHELTIIRHRKVLRGDSYRCRKCGERLWYANLPKPTTPQYTFNIGT